MAMPQTRNRSRWWWRGAVAAALAGSALAAAGWSMVRMPGSSFRGKLPPLTEAQRDLSAELERHVRQLADEIGPRHLHWHDSLTQAGEYIEAHFRQVGFEPGRQTFQVKGIDCFNVEVEIPGVRQPQRIVIIGAHYDTVAKSPGANDNASGVAALLALARQMRDSQPAYTLRFVAFTNEEHPFHLTGEMGSQVYARRSRERGEDIVAMISFDGLGMYRDDHHSQRYPRPFSYLYPSTGDFIGFVGDIRSMAIVRRAVGTFRSHVEFPSQGAALPRAVADINRSDHSAFWREGYRGFLISDTLPFRDSHYHEPTDTSDRLDYDRMARAVEGIRHVIADLAGA
jgi:hypothetical protein